jgi:putative transcriptional regulator
VSPSHPNRGGKDRPGRNPQPEEIRQLRDEMELTQAELAALLHASVRSVQKWEQGERRMHPGLWEYLTLLQAYPVVARAQRLWRAGAPATERP